MAKMSAGHESDAEPMSMDMLEDIRNGIQYHLIINRRETSYKIYDCIKKMSEEWEVTFLLSCNMGKNFTKSLRLFFMEFHKYYQFWLNRVQKFLTSLQYLETLQK